LGFVVELIAFAVAVRTIGRMIEFIHRQVR
jgi:hypothetical protein